MSSWNKQITIMQMCLFDPVSFSGLEYNLIRLPIASNDGSNRNYTYDDVVGDLSLSQFSLVDEDIKMKVGVA